MYRIFLFIRSLIFLLVMITATVIWAPVSMCFAFLPYVQRYKITAMWNRFIIFAARVICGIEYEVRGKENFPDGPAILLAKHQSAWETIFLMTVTPRPLVFVFKKEILYLPFFGWAIALLRMIPIDRSKGKDAFNHVVRHGTRRLADGQWIVMFPEGTRIRVGSKGTYKLGGTRLAVATKSPVIPVALNSGEFWPKNSFIKHPGKVIVSIGKPISSEGKDAGELMQEVENWIESEMRVISPDVYRDQAAA